MSIVYGVIGALAVLSIVVPLALLGAVRVENDITDTESN